MTKRCWCGKELEFRGFCSKKCHDDYYDEAFGEEIDEELKQKLLKQVEDLKAGKLKTYTTEEVFGHLKKAERKLEIPYHISFPSRFINETDYIKVLNEARKVMPHASLGFIRAFIFDAGLQKLREKK